MQLTVLANIPYALFLYLALCFLPAWNSCQIHLSFKMFDQLSQLAQDSPDTFRTESPISLENFASRKLSSF